MLLCGVIYRRLEIFLFCCRLWQKYFWDQLGGKLERRIRDSFLKSNVFWRNRMIILDVEASGLAIDSYPIEIAWQHRSDSRKFDSFLINPPDRWIFWDQYAEDHIHHISRNDLRIKGISIHDAANRLNFALKGKVVYTDAAEYDRRWIAELFREAGFERKFQIQEVMSLVPPSKEGSYNRHFNKSPVVHRALDDVRKIIDCLNYIAPDSGGGL